MLEHLVHEPLAREIGQPLLTLSSLNKIDLIWYDFDIITCMYPYIITCMYPPYHHMYIPPYHQDWQLMLCLELNWLTPLKGLVMADRSQSFVVSGIFCPSWNLDLQLMKQWSHLMPSVQVQLSEIQDKIHNTTSNKVSKTIIQISEKNFVFQKLTLHISKPF